MNLPLQITWRGIAQSPALDAAIRCKVAKLQRFNDRITRCRVVVELGDRHKNHGKQFAVRVNLTLPGGEITVNHDQDEDVHVAVRDAFDAARRQLQDFAHS